MQSVTSINTSCNPQFWFDSHSIIHLFIYSMIHSVILSFNHIYSFYCDHWFIYLVIHSMFTRYQALDRNCRSRDKSLDPWNPGLTVWWRDRCNLVCSAFFLCPREFMFPGIKLPGSKEKKINTDMRYYLLFRKMPEGGPTQPLRT